MWKSIVLCVSLFGGAAMGLALGARFVEPAALPAAAAIGLCVIGVVLIMAAPTDEDATNATSELEAATTVTTSTAVDPLEVNPMPAPATTPIVSNRTPTMPFEALNS